jgi:hypothetical protein
MLIHLNLIIQGAIHELPLQDVAPDCERWAFVFLTTTHGQTHPQRTPAHPWPGQPADELGKTAPATATTRPARAFCRKAKGHRLAPPHSTPDRSRAAIRGADCAAGQFCQAWAENGIGNSYGDAARLLPEGYNTKGKRCLSCLDSGCCFAVYFCRTAW